MPTAMGTTQKAASNTQTSFPNAPGIKIGFLYLSAHLDWATSSLTVILVRDQQSHRGQYQVTTPTDSTCWRDGQEVPQAQAHLKIPGYSSKEPVFLERDAENSWCHFSATNHWWLQGVSKVNHNPGAPQGGLCMVSTWSVGTVLYSLRVSLLFLAPLQCTFHTNAWMFYSSPNLACVNSSASVFTVSHLLQTWSKSLTKVLPPFSPCSLFLCPVSLNPYPGLAHRPTVNPRHFWRLFQDHKESTLVPLAHIFPHSVKSHISESLKWLLSNLYITKLRDQVTYETFNKMPLNALCALHDAPYCSMTSFMASLTQKPSDAGESNLAKIFGVS